MTGLDRRLRLLESSVSGDGCPGCGLTPDTTFDGYEVLWDDDPDQEPTEPEFCEMCGRQTTFVVRWHDVEIGECSGKLRKGGRG